MTDTTHDDLVRSKAARKLNEVHRQVCFENGDHALEVDTPYSLGAAAINLTTATKAERDALAEKLAKAVESLESMQKVPRSDASHGIMMVMISYILAELKGQNDDVN
jgi:hypothetical protein